MSFVKTSSASSFGEVATALNGTEKLRLTEVEAREWMTRLSPERAVKRLRTMPGRETFLIEMDGRLVVVKRIARDAPRERWYERFRGRGLRSASQREFDNLRDLERAGLAVPEALIWVRDSNGESLVAMEHIPHREDLEQRLSRGEAGERRAQLESLASLVARLHTAGFYHRDLYLSHLILRAETEELTLLDVGRARCEASPRQRWFVKDLAALFYSRPRKLRRTEALRCLRDYLSLRGLERSELRTWVRAIVRKAARIAAHAPQYVDSETFRPDPDSVSVAR